MTTNSMATDEGKIPDAPRDDNAISIWVCRSRLNTADVRFVGMTQAECVNRFIAGIGGKNWFVSTASQLAKRNLHIVRASAVPWRDGPRDWPGFWCLEYDYRDDVLTDIVGVGSHYGQALQSAVTNGNVAATGKRPPNLFYWPLRIVG